MQTKTSEYILETNREYAIYVCEARAIPHLSDGLKASQRKALWVIRNKRDKIKTISLAGEMISSGIYVHGDSPATQAISLMAAPFCNTIPLLEGIGAFGTRVNPQAFGAPRYTYVRKTKFLDDVVFIDLDIVPLKENYDGSTKEPETFLPTIPLILLNGISGIAIGWSTEILPHHPSDIVKATIDVLKGKQVKDLVPYFHKYDVISEPGEQQGSWIIKGKVKKVDKRTVRIESLPPDISLEKLKGVLDNLVASGKIKYFEDNSTSKIDVIVKFRANDLEKYTEDDLINMFKLVSKKKERIVCIYFDGKSIKQYENHSDLIRDFVNWRLSWYLKRYEYRKEKAEKELRYWQAVYKLIKSNIVKDLHKFESKKELKDKIAKITGCNDEIADKLADMPIHSWTKKNRQNLEEKIKNLEEEVDYCNKMIESEELRKEVYLKELEDLRKKIKSYLD